ncbi:DUF4190 domain-containing protein [Myxococcus stipitatus]|uniref:DUF4190 domain-containing protein n=1 Tax=Myxococcus stipitatus TaxID=83455 RepID=UPI001F1A28A9|nr:DUF4190 domain-containing protein [Myxococcus stipitatus]MCE9668446.1 DUF4190 domain-containing protein [Myxococcus stipitatus]
MSSQVLSGGAPRCAVHPEHEASATCQRCGNFTCLECVHWVLDQVYCTACAFRPEVNYLEAFRLSVWGKRDANAWVVAFGTLLLLLATFGALVAAEWSLAVVLAGASGVGVAFFLGVGWARPALVVTPIVLGAFGMARGGVGGLVVGFLLFVSALQIHLDTRTRLFFREDVPRRELKRLWELRVNNPVARHAMSVGIGAFFLPVLAPVAIVLGIVGLRRVDPNARPPIGRRGQALAGVVLGCLSLAAWGFLFLPLIARFVEGVLRPIDG